jgi:ubiquinone/menaquinone biosynthesis C-methylase UbiE
MSNQQLYNSWSANYDTVENKTRDLEKIACREILSTVEFETVIELGCGTGKNTEWLASRAKHVLAVDSSEEMQAVAKQKVKSDNVEFKQADITKNWNFSRDKADLITCSLILEHVENLEFIFSEAHAHLNENGNFYICELHPFKQYTGSKARFETAEGLQVLECFTHHLSDYIQAAQKNDFSVIHLAEWFDNNDRTTVPRLISFLFNRKSV